MMQILWEMSGRPLSARSRKTAPDGESEAELSAPLGEKPQVIGVMRCAPGRIRTRDTRFRSFPWTGL